MTEREIEDMGLGYSIVKSNDEVEGVFIHDGEHTIITNVSYNKFINKQKNKGQYKPGW